MTIMQTGGRGLAMTSSAGDEDGVLLLFIRKFDAVLS